MHRQLLLCAACQWQHEGMSGLLLMLGQQCSHTCQQNRHPPCRSLLAVVLRAGVLQALMGSAGVPTVGNVIPQAVKVRAHGCTGMVPRTGMLAYHLRLAYACMPLETCTPQVCPAMSQSCSLMSGCRAEMNGCACCSSPDLSNTCVRMCAGCGEAQGSPRPAYPEGRQWGAQAGELPHGVVDHVLVCFLQASKLAWLYLKCSRSACRWPPCMDTAKEHIYFAAVSSSSIGFI